MFLALSRSVWYADSFVSAMRTHAQCAAVEATADRVQAIFDCSS
jgi:hypothetical protein